ncbi:UvrD-helicase domain-containing protein [Neobacillus sp. GCM10023253]|uniref:UvrD-helicase domain-containing protein n=1 Tax=Neobacillus sp. GCM10023253 TaxID=3252644 RepID=UPI003610F494
MFIEGMVEYRPGIEAEKHVWNYVKTVFSNRNSFGFLHYPMFKKNHSGKREIDILLVDRELGLNVIEVKGLNINNIVAVQGHIWHYTNFYGDEGQPYNQAEQQLNMLCDDIEKKAILYRTFSKRAVVALPYITSKQWAERGFSQLLNSPPILFQDDFEQGIWVQKLGRMGLYRARTPMNDHKWLALKKHFYIKEQQQEVSIKKKNHFSRLYVFTKSDQFKKYQENIETALKDGIKIYLFCTFPISGSWLNALKDFRDEFQFQVFQAKHSNMLPEYQVITDGKGEPSFLKDVLGEHFPEFNYGQFIATHTPPAKNLMITAGAGTGKTYVMIDRILFLLEKADITLKDIVMVTFTNASTDEMKERLQRKLLKMFKLTGKTKYLYFSEEVKNMQISTIHSFSKTILTQLAHEIGFGRNVKVRSFIKIKQDIIERLADEFFQNHSVKELVRIKQTYYGVVDMMMNFWDEMEKKGLTRQEIEELEWGQVADENYKVLHDLFKFVFKRCEKSLEEEKKKLNAIDTGDMIRKLKLFTQNGNHMTQLNRDKFVFVDEFQDSDNTQIELVASLRNQLNYQLFVVGDIKQSIYRFRGADYTSFERLEERVESKDTPKFEPIALNQNYRTTSSLLKKLDKVFSFWGQDRWGKDGKHSLLPYTENDRLRGMEITEPNTDELQYPSTSKKVLEVNTIEQIRTTFEVAERLPDDENRKIALIVRTNRHAQEVRNWCEKAKIGTVSKLDGTFFKSDAVLHFKSLLDALLYPHEPMFVITLLQSPYFGYQFPSKLLVPFKGDHDKILDYIKSHMKDDFTRYLEDLRLLPVMAVIQKVISEKGLFENINRHYQAKYEGNVLTIETAVKQYEKNMFHLMNLIQQQFDSMNGTLWSIHEWLTLQIRVNRNEDEPVIESQKGVVEITTVHRSKGLEYHTVIMPKLNSPFGHNRTTFYVQDEKEMEGNVRTVGWTNEQIHNDHFASLQNYEKFEQEREETRLLYVAMTRAKKRLILMMPEKIMENSWASLLQPALTEVKHED